MAVIAKAQRRVWIMSCVHGFPWTPSRISLRQHGEAGTESQGISIAAVITDYLLPGYLLTDRKAGFAYSVAVAGKTPARCADLLAVSLAALFSWKTAKGSVWPQFLRLEPSQASRGKPSG